MKKAIVIGASSGIGNGIAKLLADNNYIVGITGSRTELLEKLKSEKPDSFLIKTFDVTDLETTVGKLNELKVEMGELEILKRLGDLKSITNDMSK